MPDIKTLAAIAMLFTVAGVLVWLVAKCGVKPNEKDIYGRGLGERVRGGSGWYVFALLFGAFMLFVFPRIAF